MEGEKARRLLLAATAGASLSMPSVSAQVGLSAQDILRRADEVRLPRERFEVLVNLRTAQAVARERHLE